MTVGNPQRPFKLCPNRSAGASLRGSRFRGVNIFAYASPNLKAVTVKVNEFLWKNSWYIVSVDILSLHIYIEGCVAPVSAGWN